MTSDSPYLLKGRLAEVLAAIQAMATNPDYRQSVEDWAYYLSGSRADDNVERWRTVFEEHPEFFRPSVIVPGEYGLLLRRSMPKVHSPTGKGELRPPIETADLKVLLDVALGLHSQAVARDADKRWWLPIVVPFTGSLLGAVIGALSAYLIKTH
jgi:hypothetical protein